jgi:FkbM family methyltransferase
MISYCRNLEDVIIQRVFADVPDGRYVDIGAALPVRDSNTFALYERGWRGIAADPLLEPAEWQIHRPRDLALRTLVGAQPGTKRLFIYTKAAQASTASADARELWAQQGSLPDIEIECPAITANDLMTSLGPAQPIHLVSIDVEGMEADVLAGIDFQHYRPWLLVIEAMLPGLQVPSHMQWEPALLQSGYHMAYFDGVNRYYLAWEQRALLSRLALPPNVWDHYERASERDAMARIRELEARLAATAPRDPGP